MLAITNIGKERTSQQDFAEYCQIVVWNNGVDAAKLFVASVLCADAMGRLPTCASFGDLLRFVSENDDEIMEPLLPLA